jgi:hypothetical protein
LKGEDLYGDDAEEHPDLVVVPRRYVLSGGASSGPMIRNVPVSNHSADGILIINGRQVSGEGAFAEASIMDVAPTVLHVLGIPIPSDMDGRILFEAFEDGSALRSRAPRYQSPSQVAPVSQEVADDLAVEERLRGLGYIE